MPQTAKPKSKKARVKPTQLKIRSVSPFQIAGRRFSRRQFLIVVALVAVVGMAVVFFSQAASGTTLFFIKTRNTGQGTVEIHSAVPGHYTDIKAGEHDPSWISSADADNGVFQMVGTTLYFIKTKNTGTGQVEIHSAVAGHYGDIKAGIHAKTWISTADADNGTFQMVGTTLYFIKTRNTAGTIEIHTAVPDHYDDIKYAQHFKTWIGLGDGGNGVYQMVGTTLYFIKTQNTGTGQVEAHTAVPGHYDDIKYAQHIKTHFGVAENNNGTFEMVGSSVYLVVNKNPNTTHKTVEMHSAEPPDYTNVSAGQHDATWFSTADDTNGTFQIQTGVTTGGGSDTVVASPTTLKVIQAGKDEIAKHIRYEWGGGDVGGPTGNPPGFDCSGFMRYVLYQGAGVTAPHNAQAQYNATVGQGNSDPLNSLQPGDLLFFGTGSSGVGHVAMYIGNKQMMEAPHSGGYIQVVTLRTSGLVGAGYYPQVRQ